MQDLESLKAQSLAQIVDAQDDVSLEAVRVALLGKKGEISLKMRELGKMEPETRKTVGAALNALRDVLDTEIKNRKADFAKAALEARLAQEWSDVTLEPRSTPQGTLHPISKVTEELIAIFADLGFEVRTGPQIESLWNNFDALNIGPEHPARQEMDTFYMSQSAESERHVLRTHTSPVQIRTLIAENAPVRFIAPGRVYRSDYDQTHTPMFHQIEGMCIDRDISMANLKWTLEEVLRAFFEVDHVETRFRSSYFPFTEPSAEVDVRCSWEGGTVKIGEGDDWLEILGSGMVHPQVLRNCGVDPEIWQGFAFGIGIDRLTMLKYGMPDLRPFFDSDLRWLRHYGFPALSVPTMAGGLNP